MGMTVEAGRLSGVYEPAAIYVNPLALSSAEVFDRAYFVKPDSLGKQEIRFAASVAVDQENAEFAAALFPRDWNRALIAAPELRPYYIETCARHMSFLDDERRDSEVGKVIHELREWSDDLPERTKALYKQLQAKWATPNSPRVMYYGAADVTADFFSRVAEEAQTNPEILNQNVYNDDLQREISISTAAKAAIDWVVNTIVTGPNGKPKPGLNHEYLLESVRRNPEGTIFQNITDGDLSTMHMEGKLEGVLGNYHLPVAHLEVQLGAIRALEHAALVYPEQHAYYIDLADKVWKSTLKCFYMPEKKYFAAAVDRDEETQDYRQVKTLSIMGASLLNSHFFDRLPEEEKRRYITEIVTTLLSDKFVTNIGLRVKSHEYAHALQDPQNPFANVVEYQGVMSNWVVLVMDSIQGLRRQGFYTAAHQLENRLLNFVHSNSPAEFGLVGAGDVYSDGRKINIDGVVVQNYKTKKEFDSLTDEEKALLIGERTVIHIQAPCPQGNLLMTAAAILKIKQDRQAGVPLVTPPDSWQREVEQTVFNQQGWKYVEVLEGKELEEFSDNPYFFIIDDEQGRQVESRIRQKSENKRINLTGRRKTNQQIVE